MATMEPFAGHLAALLQMHQEDERMKAQQTKELEQLRDEVARLRALVRVHAQRMLDEAQTNGALAAMIDPALFPTASLAPGSLSASSLIEPSAVRQVSSRFLNDQSAVADSYLLSKE